jgi:hypothetical protein
MLVALGWLGAWKVPVWRAVGRDEAIAADDASRRGRGQGRPVVGMDELQPPITGVGLDGAAGEVAPLAIDVCDAAGRRPHAHQRADVVERQSTGLVEPQAGSGVSHAVAASSWGAINPYLRILA